MHLNVLNNFCKKGMKKIWLQIVQEVKGQRIVDMHSAQAAERRTLYGLNLIKEHSKKHIQIPKGMLFDS